MQALAMLVSLPIFTLPHACPTPVVVYKTHGLSGSAGTEWERATIVRRVALLVTQNIISGNAFLGSLKVHRWTDLKSATYG